MLQIFSLVIQGKEKETQLPPVFFAVDLHIIQSSFETYLNTDQDDMPTNLKAVVHSTILHQQNGGLPLPVPTTHE